MAALTLLAPEILAPDGRSLATRICASIYVSQLVPGDLRRPNDHFAS
jgi:hypothetical protein